MVKLLFFSFILILITTVILVACGGVGTITQTVTSTLNQTLIEEQTLTQTKTQTHTVTVATTQNKSQTQMQTQIQTATITQTTSLSQEILYSDYFDQIPSNWTTYSDIDGYATVKDGAIYIKNYTDSDGACDSYPGESFSDFALEVEMTFVGGVDLNWQSVICRYSEATYYTFNISADGYYAIYLVNSADIYTLTEPAYSDYIQQGNSTNMVRIECIGNNLSLIVNDQMLAHVIDSASSSGEIGLAVYSMDGVYSEVSFDNLVVYSP